MTGVSRTAVTATRPVEWRSYEQRLLSDIVSPVYFSVRDNITVVALLQVTLDAAVSVLVPVHANDDDWPRRETESRCLPYRTVYSYYRT